MHKRCMTLETEKIDLEAKIEELLKNENIENEIFKEKSVNNF